MNPLKYISQSRAQLMALAILGVLFVHSGIKIPNRFVNFMVQMGYGGVDLFFFLSGFGLFFSCRKFDGCFTFWKKRIKRIMPAYLVCILITQLVLTSKINWTHLWQDSLFIGYWIKPLKWHYFAWFVSGIMGLYLIFPFYYKVFRRYPTCSTILASLLGLLCAGIYSYYFLKLHPSGCNTFIHLFARLPLFFLGVLFAYLCENNYVVNKRRTIVILLLPFIGFTILRIVSSIGLTYNQMRNSGILFYPFVIIIPGLAITFGYLFSRFPSMIRKIFGWIGKSTLEAYLLIGVVFHYRMKFIHFVGGNNIYGCLLMILICICFACLIHFTIFMIENNTLKLIQNINSKIKKV